MIRLIIATTVSKDIQLPQKETVYMKFCVCFISGWWRIWSQSKPIFCSPIFLPHDYHFLPYAERLIPKKQVGRVLIPPCFLPKLGKITMNYINQSY